MRAPCWYRIDAVPPMLRRIARVVSGLLGLSAALVSPAAAQPMFSVQEIVLRAKPAVVLISAEVNAEVTLDCGNGVQTVTPPTFRETGTGWFVDSRGWVITNGHVVEPAHSPPPWLVNQQAQRAVATACLPKVLAQRGINPGERPDLEDAIKRKLLDAVLPTTKVKLNPQVTVVISSGVRHKARGDQVHAAHQQGARGHVGARPRPPPDSRRGISGDPPHGGAERADRRSAAHSGLPRGGAHARAAQQVRLAGCLRQQRRGVGAQGRRLQPAGHPDGCARFLGQLRRSRRESARASGGRAHLRVARAGSGRRPRPGLQLRHSRRSRAGFRQGNRRPARRRQQVQRGVVRGAARLLGGRLQERGAPLREGRCPRAEPPGRQAAPRRDARVREEPPAAALPVVLGGLRRHPGERGGLRGAVSPALAEEPPSGAAVRGGEAPRERQAAPGPRRAHAGGLRHAAAQDPRLHPPLPRGARRAG